MDSLSYHTKKELYNALEGAQSGVFVIDGKLVSIEVENLVGEEAQDPKKDLAQEIEEHSELKASLTRYLNHPDMRRYSRNELKARRYARRK